jgi:hypothetical protein
VSNLFLAGKVGSYSWVSFQSEPPQGTHVQIGNVEDEEDMALLDITRTHSTFTYSQTQSGQQKHESPGE